MLSRTEKHTLKQKRKSSIELKSMASGEKSTPMVEYMLKMLNDPTHISYIAERYLKCGLKEAEEIISRLVDGNILYEPYPVQAPKYYAKKNKS